MSLENKAEMIRGGLDAKTRSYTPEISDRWSVLVLLLSGFSSRMQN